MKVYPIEFIRKAATLFRRSQVKSRISCPANKKILSGATEFYFNEDCMHTTYLSLKAYFDAKKEKEHLRRLKEIEEYEMPSNCIDHKPSQCKLTGICKE